MTASVDDKDDNVELRAGRHQEDEDRIREAVLATLPTNVGAKSIITITQQQTIWQQGSDGCPTETLIAIEFDSATNSCETTKQFLEALPMPRDSGNHCSFHTTIHKPMADVVTPDDILEALPPQFTGGQRTFQNAAAKLKDSVWAQIEELADGTVVTRRQLAEFLQANLMEYTQQQHDPPFGRTKTQGITNDEKKEDNAAEVYNADYASESLELEEAPIPTDSQRKPNNTTDEMALLGDENVGTTPNRRIVDVVPRSTAVPTSGDQPTASIIFGEGTVTTSTAKSREINILLDQCEALCFPFRKKLNLSKMEITADDIPIHYLCGTALGNALYKLSLARNCLGSIPVKLVQSLPALKHLDLSQCGLYRLPEGWNLPQLKRLNLSHNRLRDFPSDNILEGLPELTDLNLYGNKIDYIPIARGRLSKLEVLNLGYNDLAHLPEDLDLLTNLRVLKVMNNFIEKVPMRICEMNLKMLDVSFNPIIQPPVETCERGICSMRRYFRCLRQEER